MQSQENLKEDVKVINAAICICFHWGIQIVQRAEWSLTVMWLFFYISTFSHFFFLQNIELYLACIRIDDDRKLQIIYSHFEAS